jgi:Bacteriophage minor capsid protein
MAVVDDVIAYIDANTALTAGTDLFEGPMSEQPDAQVAVTHYAGEEGEYGMGTGGAAVEIPRIQVMVRDTTMAAAKTTIATIHALLDNKGDLDLNGTRFYLLRSLDGPPFSLGQDTNSRWRRVVNYRIQKVAS